MFLFISVDEIIVSILVFRYFSLIAVTSLTRQNQYVKEFMNVKNEGEIRTDGGEVDRCKVMAVSNEEDEVWMLQRVKVD